MIAKSERNSFENIPTKVRLAGKMNLLVQSNCIANRHAKLFVLFAHDTIAACTLALVLLLGLAQPAYAYVDPSVMTYTIQALAGVAVALSAVLGVVFRRTRKALFKLFKIDENANRIVERAIERADSDGTDAPQDELNPNSEVSQRLRNCDAKPSLKRRICLASFASFLGVFLICFAAPIEIYSAGQGDLTIALTDILPVLAIAALLLFLLLTCVLTCLRGKAFHVGVALVFALGICCYVQAMFMNGGLPIADGWKMSLADHIPITVISTVVWLAVITAAIAFSLTHTRVTQNALATLALVIVVVQAVGVGSIFVDMQTSDTVRNTTKDVASADAVSEDTLSEGALSEDVTTAGAVATSNNEWYVTEDGLFEVGSKNNVIVFVLDTFDDKYLDEILENDPTALDAYTGFTRYDNCTAQMIPTRYGVPFLLTGELPSSDEDFENYLAERYVRSDFIERIAQAGYTVGLYSDTLQFDRISDQNTLDTLVESTINLHDVDRRTKFKPLSTLKILYQCALYRDAPWLMKNIFWFYTDQINHEVIDDSVVDPADTLYEINDAIYYEKLQESGLTVNDRDAHGTFRFIHLAGSHTPYSLNEYGENVGKWNSTAVEQSRGVLRIIEQYLDELKRLGVYDDATIIVTADHGYWWFSDTPLEYPTSTIMLVKSAGAANEPYVTSSVPAAQSDFQATVLAAMGINTPNDGTPISEVADGRRLRYYYTTLTNNTHDIGIDEWLIDGNVDDFDNWSLTGTHWDITESILSYM